MKATNPGLPLPRARTKKQIKGNDQGHLDPSHCRTESTHTDDARRVVA